MKIDKKVKNHQKSAISLQNSIYCSIFEFEYQYVRIKKSRKFKVFELSRL